MYGDEIGERVVTDTVVEVPGDVVGTVGSAAKKNND